MEVAAVFVMAWGMVFLTGTQLGISGIGRKSWLFLVIYALSDFLIMILSWLVKQSLRAFLFQEVQL